MEKIKPSFVLLESFLNWCAPQRPQPSACPHRELGPPTRPHAQRCDTDAFSSAAGRRLKIAFSELSGKHARVEVEDEAVAGEDDQLRLHRGAEMGRPGERFCPVYKARTGILWKVVLNINIRVFAEQNDVLHSMEACSQARLGDWKRRQPV